MLLGKSVEYDTRVKKEAETLAALGYDVRVLAAVEGPAGVETVDAVTYEQVELRRPTRDAWRRHRERQQRKLDARRRQYERLRRRLRGLDTSERRTTEPSSAGVADRRRPAARGLDLAGRTYRAKNRLERQIYLHVHTPARHFELSASMRDRLAAFDPHIVHSHDLATLYAGYRYARARHIPLVYDAHELELHTRGRRTRYDRLVARVVETLGVRAASAVITVSPEIATELARTYSAARPAVVLNSPPLTAGLLEAPLTLREACGVGPDGKVVVYTGLLVPGRGLEQTASALALLPASYHFAVLGPREPAPEAAFLEHVGQVGVEDRVHLVDPVPARLVPAVVGTADAAIIPLENVCLSYELTLPNKLFDAVMAGTPVVTSSVQAVSAFVREHALGAVFEVERPDSIARAIVEVTEQVPAGIADRARLERLQARVSWEQQERVLQAVYAGVTAAAPR